MSKELVLAGCFWRDIFIIQGPGKQTIEMKKKTFWPFIEKRNPFLEMDFRE
jgi:hypothetical protein